MADTMIERVAQTLHELTLKNTGQSRGAADMMGDARAIVAAMREPTEEIEAAWRAIPKEDAEGFEYRAGPFEGWHVAIDAALAEEG